MKDKTSLQNLDMKIIIIKYYKQLDAMGKFLERYKLPKFHQEEMDSMTTLIYVKGTEFIVTILPRKKMPSTMNIPINYSTLLRRYNANFTKSPSK